MFITTDYNLKSIYDINLEELKNRGVKLFLFDLDSTIMVSKSGKYLPETMEWLHRVKKDFKIVVVSNNKHTDYLSKVREISDFDVLGYCSKPNTKVIKNYLRKQGVDAAQCALVGDRPLTDILCGRRLGCLTVLVDSINAENEGWPTRFVRRLERLTIKNN